MVTLGELDFHLLEEGLSESESKVLLFLHALSETAEGWNNVLKLSLGSERMHVLDVHDGLVNLLSGTNIRFLKDFLGNEERIFDVLDICHLYLTHNIYVSYKK